MSDAEKKQEHEVVEVVNTEKTATTEEKSDVATTKKKPIKAYVAAVVVVAVILLGVVYLLEKEGRSSTNIFADLIARQQANMAVATVNGAVITNDRLVQGMQQFNQMAESQGVDINDPMVQENIKSDTLDLLINTELLKQAAAERGMEATEEEVTARIAEVEEQMGGVELLDQRMAELGITKERLRSDIADELLISELLEALFAEANFEVTEEEMQEFYDANGGAEAGLPPLEEIAEQIKAQLASMKEQGVVDDYLTELKELATIEIPG